MMKRLPGPATNRGGGIDHQKVCRCRCGRELIRSTYMYLIVIMEMEMEMEVEMEMEERCSK